eukprot:scaffold7882_cov140-Isochrysis_galbana.AAC.2
MRARTMRKSPPRRSEPWHATLDAVIVASPHWPIGISTAISARTTIDVLVAGPGTTREDTATIWCVAWGRVSTFACLAGPARLTQAVREDPGARPNPVATWAR